MGYLVSAFCRRRLANPSGTNLGFWSPCCWKRTAPSPPAVSWSPRAASTYRCKAPVWAGSPSLGIAAISSRSWVNAFWALLGSGPPDHGESCLIRSYSGPAFIAKLRMKHLKKLQIPMKDCSCFGVVGLGVCLIRSVLLAPGSTPWSVMVNPR